MSPNKIILLFFFAFSYILAQTIDTRKDGTYTGSSKTSFEISFDYGDLPNYIHFIIKSSNAKPYAVTSFTDSTCQDNRSQMAFQPYGSLDLFMKKEEFNRQSKAYLCVDCIKDEGGCSYTVEVKRENIATLEIGSYFKYNVNGRNTIMQFLFTVKEGQQVDDGTLLHMWAKGEKITNTDIYPIKMRDVEFDHGKAFYGKYEKSSQYILTLTALEGDYISIGSYFVSSGTSKNIISINEAETIGNLNFNLNKICYNIQQIDAQNQDYVSFDGIVFKNKLQFRFRMKGGVEVTTRNITDGVLNEIITIDGLKNMEAICFTYCDDDDKREEIVFSFQYLHFKSIVYNQLIIPPQIPGYIYRHRILNGEKALFQGMITNNEATEINYNLKTISGFPDMKFYKCTNYPKCVLSDSTPVEDPHHTNRMTVKSFYLKDEQKITTISAFQPLLVVECTNSDKNEESCYFETSIFTNKDRLLLKENSTFSQYLLEYESDLYSIDFTTEDNKDKIFLDLIIFSGDVNLIMDSNIKANKYYLSNKIFYSIHIKESSLRKKIINFKVTAYKKSFYMIQYQMVKEGEEKSLANNLESGVNYLESVSVGEYGVFEKYIDIDNYLMFQNVSFLLNFYSLNCKFYVFRVSGNEDLQEIEMVENYGQDVITPKDPFYFTLPYRYKVLVTDKDITEYNKQNCMLYVSGLELEGSDKKSDRAISISENVPQFFNFTSDNFYIRYVFHIADLNNVVVVNFNLIDKAKFHVTLRIGYKHENTIDRDINRNSQLFVDRQYLNQCEEDEACQLYILIRLEEEKEFKRMETTVTQIKGAPIYLQKNVMTQDILVNSEPKYYYFDIGKEEYGDIKIDYRRGSGNIFAAVVNKTGVEENMRADWRGMYDFPVSVYDSLRYETYLRKIVFTPTDTEQCENGCLILITVRSTTSPSLPDNYTQDNITLSKISITPRVIPKELEKIEDTPMISVTVNEFIIGNIYESDKSIYEFYKIYLPFDSESIVIDWQSDGCYLYLKFGDEKPRIDDKYFDFEFKDLGYKTVYEIKKQDILSKLPPEKSINTLKHVPVILGVYTKKTDTLYTTMYAYRITQPLTKISPSTEEQIVTNILHVKSDQRVQCKPKSYANRKYTCLFAVVFDSGDIGKSLLVYPKGENQNVPLDFSSDIVDAEPVERNSVDDIAKILPKDNSQFTSKNSNYIFVPKIEKNKALLILTTVSNEMNIEILSSITTGDEDYITPNPTTPQVFGLNLLEGKSELKFSFDTSQNLLINIAGIYGEGFFKWDEEIDSNRTYYIYGYEDRLTLTSFTSKEEYKLTTLTVKSVDFSFLESEDKKFVFYMTFYPRSDNFNIDQIKIGRSTEFNYRELKFPLNYYTILEGDFISASFNFYNLYTSSRKTVASDKPMLRIWGKIVDGDEVAESRMMSLPLINDSLAVNGLFDGAFGSLTLNKADIDKYKVPDGKKYFYFSIEINKEIALDFNGASIEVTVLKKSQSFEQQSFVAEHVYQNGKLTTENTQFTYKLKTTRKNPYMAVEFATNGNIVKYAIGPNENYQENLKYKFEEQEVVNRNGKSVITFKINEDILRENKPLYLNIYTESKLQAPHESNLTNYIFKYMCSKEKNYFNFFTITNDKVKYEIVQQKEGANQDYKLTFTPIENRYTNYYVKLVYRDNMIEEEEKYTIAISESEGKYIQIENPDSDPEKNVSLLVEGVNKDVAYIKVLAKANIDSLNEYMLYQPVLVGGAEPEPHGEVKTLQETDALQTLIYSKTNRQIIGDAKKAKKVQKYLLTFEKEDDKPDYIKVEAVSYFNRSQILYFSPTDENGKKDRLQLAQEGVGQNVTMWIKKEQISENNAKLYIAVECQEEDCGYKLVFSGYGAAQFENSAFSYTYYVTKHNTKMLFRIRNNVKIFEMLGEVLTLYATGNKYTSMTLKDCFNDTCKQNSFLGGQAITTPLPKHNYFELEVEACEGDLVTVGSKVTFKQGLSFTNELSPNSYPSVGFLKKGVLDKECYHLPNYQLTSMTYYLSVNFFMSRGGIYFLDENLEILEATREIVTNGFYTSQYIPASDDRFICLFIPNDTDTLTFDNFTYSIQFTEPNEMKKQGLFNIFEPQLSGIIYPRIIPCGSTVFFNAIYNTTEGAETIFNMFSIRGIPKMYMYKCTNYPLCDIDYDKIDTTEGVIKISEINRMNTWHYNMTVKTTPISAEQYVMVVKCVNLYDVSSDVCEFQTSIYGSNDTVYLMENRPFSQYILKNEIEGFLIDFSGRKKVQRIYIDTLVVSGDVSFDFFDFYMEKALEPHKYYVGNKIFYSISVSSFDLPLVYIYMKAKLNSYYIIEYRIVSSEEEQLVNTIYSGANYLIPIPMTLGVDAKEIDIHNRNLLKNSYYFVSFQSLNCKFNVQQKLSSEEYETVESFGRFAQKLLKNDDENSELNVHTFRIEPTEGDYTHYDTNFCMMYASALEITNRPEEERALLLGEAVPQKVRFDNTLKSLRYIYPLMNNTKNAAIDFKINSHALFNLTIFVNGDKFDNQLFSRDVIYFLNYETLTDKCKPDTICSIVLLIEFKESYDQDVFPILETVIRQTRNVPYYLPKDIAKRDFVSGDVKLYVYTDLGRGDQGYITANFQRGSGSIYAKVVPIGEISNNTTPDWRNYTFPKSVSDSLRYNQNEKKIIFDLYDTMMCENGCYLLITLFNSVVTTYTEESRFYPLTLTVHVDKVGEELVEGRSIQIEPEQYIIGSLNDYDRITEKKMYDYYEISIPYDVENIEFDFQATTPRLLVNKGTTKPTIDKADFKFDASRGDTILTLSKKGNFSSVTNLANTILTIGIYGEDIETIYGTRYSFRVHLYKKLNIHKVNQDQKTLCKPDKRDGKYSCLFMLTYEYLQFFNDVMLFARSQSSAADIKMYGKFVNKAEYEKGYDDQLEPNIPKKGSTEFNKDTDRDFIYATFGEDHKNLFVNVITDKEDIIEFMSSFRTFDQVVTPNPTGCQVFSMAINEEEMIFHIPTTKGIFVNFVSIHGSATIKMFQDYDNTYQIRGRDDRISFGIPASKEDTSIFSIVNLNAKKNETKEATDELPGFAFYIEYYLRGYDNVNFDELTFGKTTEVSYFQSGFPLYFYAKLDKFDSNIFAVFTFHDLDYNNTDDSTREIRTEEFNLESTLVEQKRIYPAILDYQKIPQPHQAFKFDYYDPAILTGQVNYLKTSYNEIVKDSDFPMFLFSLQQVKNGTDRINYNRLRMEMTLSKENDNSFTTEKLYQYGILFDPDQVNSYKLKVVKDGFMRVEFSPGSEYVDMAIAKAKNSKQNFTSSFLSKKVQNGKYIITFKSPADSQELYFNVFFKANKPLEVLLLLNSFVFKYINSPKENEFKEYTTKTKITTLTVKEGAKNGDKISSIEVSFSAINMPVKENSNVTYSLKIAEELLSPLKGEYFDSLAMKYYQGIVKRQEGKDGDGTITIKVTNVDKGYHYAQVIAQIRDGPIIEYFAYTPHYNPNSKNKQDSGDIITDAPTSSSDASTTAPDDDTAIYVVVGISIALLVVVVVLVIVIMTFNSKNKNLLDQVNKISFSKTDAQRPINDNEGDNNSNLLMENNDELN